LGHRPAPARARGAARSQNQWLTVNGLGQCSLHLNRTARSVSSSSRLREMPRACRGSQSSSGRSQRGSSRFTLQFRRPEHPACRAAATRSRCSARGRGRAAPHRLRSLRHSGFETRRVKQETRHHHLQEDPHRYRARGPSRLSRNETARPVRGTGRCLAAAVRLDRGVQCQDIWVAERCSRLLLGAVLRIECGNAGAEAVPLPPVPRRTVAMVASSWSSASWWSRWSSVGLA
jgi:hypothetical protein